MKKAQIIDITKPQPGDSDPIAPAFHENVWIGGLIEPPDFALDDEEDNEDLPMHPVFGIWFTPGSPMPKILCMSPYDLKQYSLHPIVESLLVALEQAKFQNIPKPDRLVVANRETKEILKSSDLAKDWPVDVEPRVTFFFRTR